MGRKEQNSGEPRKHDPSFKGPILNRSCTDILCCIIFMLALLGYIAVGVLAWSQGDPKKAIYPTNSHGKLCGLAGTLLEEKPLVFYFNIIKCASPLMLLELQCPTTQICVKKCPNKFMTLVHAKMSNGEDYKYYRTFCKAGLTKDMSVTEILKSGLCPTMLIPSIPFTNRCFPDPGLSEGIFAMGNNSSIDDGSGKIRDAREVLADVKNASVLIEARQVAMKVFEDYSKSWYWILIGLLIAVLTSLLLIVLLRFLAGIMVWVMVIMVILVIGYGIVHCYMEYTAAIQKNADLTLQDLGIVPNPEVYLQVPQTWLAFMIILAIVEVIIILLLIFLRKRIVIAIALLKEASRAIGYIMSSLFYPLFTFVLLAIVIAFWAVTAVFLSTSKEAVYKVSSETTCEHLSKTCDPTNYTKTDLYTECPDSECLFAFYGGETIYHKYLIVLQFYNVFLFFWCVNFVMALGQMTLAGAFASYYWATVKPDDMPTFPILSSLGRCLRYHTGTLAFGSLILAIIQLVRVILEYLDHKLKGKTHAAVKFVLCCLKCCFWCLEKCIKFLNRNAYIMVAIYGKNFCTSAKDAFFLLLRNMVRVMVVDKVTDFLLFLCKLLIVALVGIVAFFFFSSRIEGAPAPHLHFLWVQILTVVVGTYLISHGFFSVYEMCVDTLFLCFLEDLERNDGSEERPYMMPESLRKALNKKNKETAE